MLDIAILGLLEEGELHGYEIRRRLRAQLGILANVSFGSLYPALNRLKNAGAIEATEVRSSPPRERPPAPLTGSISGERAVFKARRRSLPKERRSRKVYRITDEGRRLFTELMQGGDSEDSRTFGLRLAFARHLTPSARLGLLERRRARLVERLNDARSAARDDSLDTYARSVMEHNADEVEHDISWLDQLIANERLVPATATPTRHDDG
ncbi:MAG: PadR family transcriptional regulator [Actinobacteria bacterium]|jgi:DNA-binding PadR family transcriptional regulator|nr:PadR family transcriptional regulator [Actinomycetota bacterium]